MKQKLKAGALFIILVGIVFSLSVHLGAKRKINPISSDARGYYQYLPAIFIIKDITNQPYAFPLENGKWFNKYTCGVAMLEFPFFAATHLYTKITSPGEASGYGRNYERAVQLAAAFYFVAGMYFLFYYLRRYFPAWIIIVSLLLLYLATNLVYYAHVEPGMSHVYSFSLFAAFIYFTPYFLQFNKLKYTLIIALLTGISVLIRPTNILITLFILFYNVYNLQQLKDRLLLFLRNWWHLLIIGIAVVVIYIPQMYYWNKMLGKLFVNSYRYDWTVTGFINWRNPKIFQVLAGHRSGWLLYSPVMVLSLAGLTWITIKRTLHSRGIALIFLALLYLSASWSAYTFGTAYGYRPFIELYTFLSIPFVFILWKIYTSKKRIIQLLAAFFIFNCLFLNYRLFSFYDAFWDGLNWKWKDYFHLLHQAYYLYIFD